jgi:hypothetical protein
MRRDEVSVRTRDTGVPPVNSDLDLESNGLGHQRNRHVRDARVIGALIAVLMITCGLQHAIGQTTQSTQPTTTRVNYGPKVVILNKLENLYTAVPFEHARHAEMAEMWDGCVMCHHRSPEATTQPIDQLNHPATQEDSSKVPDCKSCHPAGNERAELHRPSLKGAYHRQCLNCHREWTGENACVVCHQPKDSVAGAALTPDDIAGRMHPPIKAPDEKLYKVRYEPVAGPNVLFRHKEHVEQFGLKCVECHRRDNCADCHKGESTPEAERPHPLKTSRTWKQTHGPCVDCHAQNDCNHCHYKDAEPSAAPFLHSNTGQTLDNDHKSLACRSCHSNVRVRKQVSCGEASCHPKKPVAFPVDRPGEYIARVPSTAPTTMPVAGTQPVTKPVVIRIRRGGR